MATNSNASQLLMRGSTQPTVSRLKAALRRALGARIANFPGIDADNSFNADTESALRTWQAGEGLVADGIAGPRTLSTLFITQYQPLAIDLNTESVRKLFPFTKQSSIEKNLPYVAAALAAYGLTSAEMISVALGTIRAETEGFVPIAELPSHFNTLPGQAAFSAYEFKKDLGNNKVGDGAHFRGRGFVQLTGRANYQTYGALLGIPLLDIPDIACAPEVASCLLAAFLAEHQSKLAAALSNKSLKKARAVVNGGSHGLDRFTETYKACMALQPAPVGRATRKVPTAVAIAAARRTKLNVTADPTDLRDLNYMPPPNSLPGAFPADSDISSQIGAYTKAKLILDQGQEGACTGFGLACVINYLRWRMAGAPTRIESVSPRMLYHFAKRFDEYAGEDYDGSSCRGALRGWYNNGVCMETKWPYSSSRTIRPLTGWDADALEQTLGVYYRIDTQSITDLQAAIHEVGAIYVSAYTHDGWDAVPATRKSPTAHGDLPIINYSGKPSRSGGHAFALLGFNRQGFIVQNSWGTSWGAGGFAILTYADWLANGMDAWVLALGVPGVVSGRLTLGSATLSLTAATQNENWWKEDEAYKHSIVLGNNGRVDRYDNIDGLQRTLMHQACLEPTTWFNINSQYPKKRLVLYAHGGLNGESKAIERVRAMGRYFERNGCYPLFLVWKSGLMETLGNVLRDKIKTQPEPSSLSGLAGNWFSDKLSDPVVESTIARPFARPLWSEMKENAGLASESGRGGDQLTEAIQALAKTYGANFELHLIGHSAGSILLGRMLSNLAQ